jgi:phosphoribosylformylglycinamidine synthase subunit PurQ / glutaminase
VSARIGVVTFPGSLDDGDAARAVGLSGAEVVRLWHADPDLHGVDAVVLPGGFSYGDYLRCGAIARFAPVMETISKAAHDGMPVLGICNGFQILCEAHLLPGALTRNQHLHFRNRDQWLRIEQPGTAWTRDFKTGQEILIPVKNGEGCYVADARTLDELEANGQIVARYIRGNPNGSSRDIAAVRNEAGNVLGIMPHPEHAVEALTGPSLDGLGFFSSVLKHLATPRSVTAEVPTGAMPAPIVLATVPPVTVVEDAVAETGSAPEAGIAGPAGVTESEPDGDVHDTSGTPQVPGAGVSAAAPLSGADSSGFELPEATATLPEPKEPQQEVTRPEAVAEQPAAAARQPEAAAEPAEQATEPTGEAAETDEAAKPTETGAQA